ncbi:hypothetical protein [Streptomyces flaveolus]|uniref:hypothetical protein n=1 Tax=Streptomyces flaveolus TaxID=67297 RepID=UPI0033C17A39
MEFTAASRAAAAMAAIILISGFAAIIHSTSHDHVAGAIGGACLVMVALSIIVCVLVRHWIVNTNTERAILAAAQREAQAERTRYIAAQAALENEMGRLNRDMAAERARIAASYLAEQTKLRKEFEEERAQLAADAFQTGVQMERAGMLKPGAEHARGKLIPLFPEQHPACAPERERSREHGNVGP